MTKEELTAKVVAAPAQAVPAPGVEAVSEREFKQFLSDVISAAGLVTHGKKCKDLGRRLGEMSMRLLPAPKTAAAPVQAGEYPPSSADMVMAALDTEEWGLERMQHWHCITDEGNRVGAWLVKRQKAPYCAVYTDKPGAPYGPRSWSGPTALDALQKAADDLGIRLPQPAARGAAQAAPVDATTWQPIATAPKDGKAILLRSKNGRIADGLWSAANSSTGFWAWAYVHQEPAEWMPKPGSPAARAQELQP